MRTALKIMAVLALALAGCGDDAHGNRTSTGDPILKPGRPAPLSDGLEDFAAGDHAAAFPIFIANAETGNNRAAYLAGACLITGVGTDTDTKRGLDFLDQAARAGNQDAANLAEEYRETARELDAGGMSYINLLARQMLRMGFPGTLNELREEVRKTYTAELEKQAAE